jgi:hypothetical protein
MVATTSETGRTWMSLVERLSDLSIAGDELRALHEETLAELYRLRRLAGDMADQREGDVWRRTVAKGVETMVVILVLQGSALDYTLVMDGAPEAWSMDELEASGWKKDPRD